MNRLGEFYTPAQMDYSVVVPAYQEAFKEDPWNEVTKCVDLQSPQRCPGGLSSNDPGALCDTCDLRPTRLAYEADELVERFSALGETRPALWYAEMVEEQVALAAVCWLTDVKRLMAEKYTDVPTMEPWLDAKFGAGSFIYLDEIFRDKTVRPTGNLMNLRPILDGFGRYFGNGTLAYRSKNERLLGKTQKDFGLLTDIAWADEGQVPDWRRRSFATIKVGAGI